MDKSTLLELESNAQTLLYEVRMMLDELDATSSVCDESIRSLANRIYELSVPPINWQTYIEGYLAFDEN